ncbi:hypothetical protein FK178_08790 [Antarcticibacterium arcticum]|uniref:DUF6268 domain-containing protein n=1 Tax=Antarcticibacterium arcticum TaxID=2585771 RepID=A0A5B8YJJ9_9FLAO|nr:DUF6268 family outer membrane beta-barrel protein [Antarcticibacterium arcticum]QED37811.1 hypothetical protein FK178_08790 [Antarcticibacterium arcticum]
MKKSCNWFLMLLIAGITGVAQGQTTDLARIEYTYFPQKDSDNSFRRFRSFINFPIKLNENGAYLVPGIEYRNTNLKYNDPAIFDTNELDRFQSFSGSLGYTFKMNEIWRFGAEAGLRVASNFETGEMINDDVIYTGAVYFIKTTEDERYIDPVRLILGLSYSTTSGIPFPLPVINYYKRFSPDWSYTLGIPKSNLKYFINEKNVLQGFVTLDGFFANIQNNFYTTPNSPSSNMRMAENISMTIVLAGLGYEYNFTDNLSLYLYAGHTLVNDIRLRDGNLDKVYTINETNSFYGRTGLKFSIL